MIELEKNTAPGKLIVFEGTDGAGKTTMIGMTLEYLRARFGEERLLFVKQPTDLSRKTKLFQKMMYCCRHEEISYRAVQLLTLSDRVQHDYEVIRPALAAGRIVVSDRYLYTSVANMLARGYREEAWFFHACRGIVKPDLAFLAYVDPETAIERIQNRPEEARRHLNKELLRRVAGEFLELGQEAEFRVLDTSGSPKLAFACAERYLNELLEDVK